MVCRVRYLNSAGIMRREIKGVDALAKAFPSEWLLYVSLSCYPRGQDPMEIDAIVVMDDRVLLLEIKDWNGKLTQANGSWYIGRQSRGRSPVVVAGEKAKKLKTVLKTEMKPFGAQLRVDERVVLTGSATREQLPSTEKRYVWTLQEACSIVNEGAKKQLLEPRTLRMFKAYSLEQHFESLFGNTKLFQPSEADWSGYQVVEASVFEHPRGVWRDHRAERRGEARFKALVRTWAFDTLPVGLNSPTTRALVASRESKALAFLEERDSDLVKRNRLLREVAAPPDEILTNHFEVRGLSRSWNTLDRYLERCKEDLSIQDRVVIASGLLSLVSQLHASAVTHRDLGPRAIWIGSPSDFAITGLMSCQLPDQESVLDWLRELRGYAPTLPEDRDGSTSTGQQRDVYMCAYLVAYILSGVRPESGASNATVSLPSDLSSLGGWLQKGLSIDPAGRHSNVTEMMEEFTFTLEPRQSAGIDQSLLDHYQVTDIPYQRWPTKAPLSQKFNCSVYVSHDDAGRSFTVKVWNGVFRGISAQSDVALLKLLDGASRLQGSPIKGLPVFVEVGLSPVGPYVVYEHSEGVPIGSFETSDRKVALTVALELLRAVSSLHEFGCDHGDISPSNVLVDSESHSVTLLDLFDLSGLGTAAVRTPAFCPPNWERIPQQAIDRYAALMVTRAFLDRSAPEKLSSVFNVLDAELQRPVVDSLEVSIHALQAALVASSALPRTCIDIATRAPTRGFQGGRDLFVRRTSLGKGLERFTLTNLTGQLVIEGDGARATSRKFAAPRYTHLAHESLTGFQPNLDLAVSHDDEAGFNDLYLYLRNEIPVALAEPSAEATDSKASLDVARHWRRMMELEEDARVEVEIKEILTTREGITVCAVENVGRDFDFDADDTINVMSEFNRRLGEIEQTLSDFPTTIAIRGDVRRLAAGDRVRLATRRDQVSIDRRAKAINRILERRSTIPDLVDYFAPNASKAPTVYDLAISDEDLDVYELNEGQREAFRSLLRSGPVGLLQGPPGTGKTRFISSFIHWLQTKGHSQRILIASQSHEAVNNAIDSLLLLYRRHGGRPNLLRIGSKGITDRIRPYFAAELRERYRLRFEAAAKYRFQQLTSAKGISRDFASDLFDLDQSVGVLSRRCAALHSLVSQEDSLPALERERNDTQYRRVVNALRVATKQFTEAETDPTRPADLYSNVVKAVAAKHSDVSPADVSGALRLLELTRDWLSSLASPQRNFEEFLAKTRNVVSATCVGVGETRVRIDSQVFDWVIIDEAARCTPGELAVPIQMARRVLLVGDHLQLKPMIVRELLDQLGELDGGLTREELSISDFERAFTSPYGSLVSAGFTEQYRMDPAICRLVSRCFYEPHSVRLQTSQFRKSDLVFRQDGPPWLRKPICWIDTSDHPRAREVRPIDSTTRYNDAEVDAVIRVLESIAIDTELVNQLSKGDDETPVGVICMYLGQKRRIEMAWARHAWDAKFRRLVRIDTVDSYQGKENAIVLLSLVASNPHHDAGHVASPNRCNVALSRAKERLFIFGALSMWGSVSRDSPMATVLRHIQTDPTVASVISMGELE